MLSATLEQSTPHTYTFATTSYIPFCDFLPNQQWKGHVLCHLYVPPHQTNFHQTLPIWYLCRVGTILLGHSFYLIF